MDRQNINILERIHATYYQLTAAERKVADYVLAQSTQVQFMSITQLAEECGTAEATISRFCKTLKVKGFNAFKIEIAKHSATVNAADPSGPAASPDTVDGRCLDAARLSQDAIRQTLELLDPKSVSQAVDLLEKAGRVICIGAGGSMLMASECAHLFSTISTKFSAVFDSHMQMSAAATMAQNDVIILFSYSGATLNGLDMLALARRLGIKTILITRFPKSPAANLADLVLRCGSNETPFQFGSVPAKVAQLVLIDMLFQEYYRRNRAEADEILQKIAAALSEKHI